MVEEKRMYECEECGKEFFSVEMAEHHTKQHMKKEKMRKVS